MSQLCRTLALFSLLLPIVARADLSDTERAEQRELLAWVRTLRLQGRAAEAASVCGLILEADPQNVEALEQRGLILLTDREYESARAAFDAALRVQPDSPLALVGRGRALDVLGLTDAAHRDVTRAVDLCTRALADNGDDARCYYVRGLARLLLQQEDGALQDFIAAGNQDEELVEAVNERARIYRRRGRFAEAIEQLSMAVRVRPDYAIGYLDRARVRFEAQDFLAARDDCDRALQINPDFARAWHNRGLTNLRLGETLQAVQDFTRALSAQPDYASAHYYRGQAYYSAGNRGAARADWEMAAELAPEEWAGEAATEMLRKIENGEL